MKSPLLYILEVLFCSGLFLAFYRLLLVRKVSFRACRRYLVAAVFLSAVIPALDHHLKGCDNSITCCCIFREYNVS